MPHRLWNRLCHYFAFKQSCLLCRQASNSLICPVCNTDLERFNLASYQNNLLLHPKIKEIYKNLDAQRLLAISNYQWPLANLVTQLKFSRRVIHAKALAELFLDSVSFDSDSIPETIIPVPLHNARFHQRKFSQAIEIANFIGNQLGISVNDRLCLRHKPTQPQTTLSGKQRRLNIRNAFSINSTFSYRHVAIFDDIVTTGSTVNELIKSIKSRNPDVQIEVWCICISLPTSLS